MAMTFRYARLQRGEGSIVKAPCITVFEQDANGRVLEIPALIDSGADSAVVPKDLAEVLGLCLSEEQETRGIGGITKAKRTRLSFRISNGRESYALSMPALVLLDETINIPLLLGRTGFFDEFEIIFRQPEEKIVLKKVAAHAY